MTETLDSLLQKGIDIYKEQFLGPLPNIATAAPARLNILGEHEDYNEGLVLTMAMPLYTIAIGTKNGTHMINIFTDCPEIPYEERLVNFTIPSVGPLQFGEPQWANYVKSTIEHFKGYILDGFNIVFVSNIPNKVGLGSSAALNLSLYIFLEILTNEVTYNKKEKARRCLDAEKEFSLPPCGSLLDLYSSVLALDGNLMFIECRNFQIRHIPIDMTDIVFLVTNSNTKCFMEEQEYASRVKLCKEALTIMGLKSLRDATVTHLIAFKEKLIEDEERDMRARHVVGENVRVQKAISSIQKYDFSTFGQLLNQSQVSLKYDYEVSSKELNELTDIVLEVEGVYGSKLTGIGFGGCTVTLVKRSVLNDVILHIKEKYSGKADMYVAEPVKGANDISFKIFDLERKVAKVSSSISTQLQYGIELFNARFETDPDVGSFAPGKVTILGEHTEQQQGYVLQMAIPLGTLIVGKKNNSDFVNIFVDEDMAQNGDDFLSFQLPKVHPVTKDKNGWQNLVKGIMYLFKDILDKGFNAIIITTVPNGAGLGCDSSLVVALYTFIELLLKQHTSDWIQKAKNCFYAEQSFSNSPGTLMDHMAVIGCKEGNILFIDCRTFKCEQIPFPLKEQAFLLTDTKEQRKKNGALFSEINNEVCDLLKVLKVPFMKEACIDLMNDKSKEITKKMYYKGTYLLNETMRAFLGAKALKMKDLQSFGVLMIQSNNSLREHYKISFDSQNRIVNMAMKCDGVIGSKVIGTEDCRSVLTLIRKSLIDEAVEKIHCGLGIHALFYPVEPKEGVQDITEVLKYELRRRFADIDYVDKLSMQTVYTHDMKDLSWSMFDTSSQWEKLDEVRRRTKELQDVSERSSDTQASNQENSLDDDVEDVDTGSDQY